jgi:hypothetical protein
MNDREAQKLRRRVQNNPKSAESTPQRTGFTGKAKGRKEREAMA